MKARLLVDLPTPNGTILAGRIVNIPDHLCDRLYGKVELINLEQTDQATDCFLLMGEALTEIDRLGRPWPRNFFDRLSRDDKVRKKELEQRIDIAVLADDRESLELLLVEWREFLLDRRTKNGDGHEID